MEFINAESIASIFILAGIVEWLIEALKPIWGDRVDSENKSNITRIVSIVLGTLIVFTTQVTLFNLGNVGLDIILTGLAISAGSGVLNNLLSKLTNAKQDGLSMQDKWKSLSFEEKQEFSLDTIDELSGSTYKEHAEDINTADIVDIEELDIAEDTSVELTLEDIELLKKQLDDLTSNEGE